MVKEMNMDNQRLREIQREKIVYEDLLDKSESITDCLIYQERLDELSSEEKDILGRCDVRI